jgi:hypothetical protein
VRKLESALGLEPYGLESPPPGVPDVEERALMELCDAISIVSCGEDEMLSTLPASDESTSAYEQFARWVMARQSRWEWSPEELRYGAAFLAALADAQEAVEEGGSDISAPPLPSRQFDA